MLLKPHTRLDRAGSFWGATSVGRRRGHCETGSEVRCRTAGERTPAKKWRHDLGPVRKLPGRTKLANVSVSGSRAFQFAFYSPVVEFVGIHGANERLGAPPKPAVSIGSGVMDYEQSRLQDDFQIEPRGPIVDVFDVASHALPKLLDGVQLAAKSIDLGPTGQARFHPVAREITVGRFLQHVAARAGLQGVRPRSDHRHCALQDIEELRQLVETCSTDYPADPGHSLVLACGLADGVGVRLGGNHGAELKQFKRPSVKPHPLLTE